MPDWKIISRHIRHGLAAEFRDVPMSERTDEALRRRAGLHATAFEATAAVDDDQHMAGWGRIYRWIADEGTWEKLWPGIGADAADLDTFKRAVEARQSEAFDAEFWRIVDDSDEQ